MVTKFMNDHHHLQEGISERESIIESVNEGTDAGDDTTHASDALRFQETEDYTIRWVETIGEDILGESSITS